MTAEDRLKALGLQLPAAPAAVAAYRPWSRVGNLVITAGQLPFRDGKLAHVGRLGEELSVEDGQEAARLCALNAIAQLKSAAGDLEKIVQIVRLEGNVHAAPGFVDHPQVLNGASLLMQEVFGDRNRHSRTALGMVSMPLGAAVQLSVWAEVRDEA